MSKHTAELARNWAEHFHGRRGYEVVEEQLTAYATMLEAARLVPEGWRPIETAPKDGTVVDVWHEEFGRYAGYYWGLPYHSCGEMGRLCDSDWHDLEPGWVDEFNEPVSGEGFTHWMPLPTAPSATIVTPAAPQVDVEALQARIAELEGRINTPHTHEWFEAVRLEAAHQIERWSVEHDAGKQPQDWFWLIGYLAGKALAAALAGNDEKAKHHTISSGAALLNWYRAMVGDTNAMRPGIEPPEDAQCGKGGE
ncbi:DUF551 domain-containing protein [Chitinolyticbacter meiyuanensis]|uniref:DUF551 domain-containing protein n=1 Tax=Chitinolyticbacter meiyuanensis TaxID=682798 RepID=UPI0011E5934B|nr:DUF551 domain-containing protein [Chitinolyticbacter meiyuanensis]